MLTGAPISSNFEFPAGFAIDNFNLGCLKSHNYYRGLHGSPTLVWSKELASDAQKWANALAKDGKFEHDLASMTNKQEGENLAYFGPPRPKCQGPKHDGCVECAEIVANWYNEITGYDFTNGKEKDPNTNIRHFAQVRIAIRVQQSSDFTSKSDQVQISPAASPEILHHTV